MKDRKKLGIIDLSVNMVIKVEFDRIEPLYYNNKLYFKTILDKIKLFCGIIKNEVKEELPPQYLFIGQFHEGLARISTAKHC